MQYNASLDRLAKIITIAVVILFTAIGQQHLRALINAEGLAIENLLHILILLLLVAILLGSWLFAPQSYTVDNTNLTINRMVGKVKIKLVDIKEVYLLTDKEMKGTIRTFGVGGLFGYYGKFNMPKIGVTTFYATKRKNTILITTQKEKKIVLTPDDISIVEKIKRI